MSPAAFVYVEPPNTAVVDGPSREEVFIKHHHIVGAASVGLPAMRTGFRLLALENLREPCGKYTLRTFLEPDRGAAAEKS